MAYEYRCIKVWVSYNAPINWRERSDRPSEERAMLNGFLCPSEETLKRIGRIEETCAAIDREMDLMRPLAAHLLPKAKQMDLNALPREGRTIELEHGDWKKQYEAGVNRCMGFDILWT